MKLYKYTDGRANASGQKIKERREAAGLSQEELAAQLQLAGLNLPKGNKPDRNRRARRARLRAALLLEGAKRANLRAAAC